MYYCDDDEVEAVAKIIRSKKLFRYQGESVSTECSLFEAEFSKYLNQKHALLLSSGTNALVTALKCIGIKRGDEVLIPAYTFFATVAAVIDFGAIPVLVDINEYLTMDLDKAKQQITKNTKAMVVVHMDGVPCDMEKMLIFARDFNLLVIEDAAQGLGASFKKQKVGTFGSVGCFSFNVDKIISCGEGGAICLNNFTQYQKALLFHDTCNQFGPTLKNQYTIEPFVGRSMRVSEIQGTLMRVQLRRLDKIVSELQNRKKIFADKLNSTGKILIPSADIDGEIGTTLRIVLNDPIEAQQAMLEFHRNGIKAIVASMRPGHNIWKWLHLLPVESKTVKENFLYTVELLSKTLLVYVSLDDEINEWNCKVKSIH